MSCSRHAIVKEVERSENELRLDCVDGRVLIALLWESVVNVWHVEFQVPDGDDVRYIDAVPLDEITGGLTTFEPLGSYVDADGSLTVTLSEFDEEDELTVDRDSFTLAGSELQRLLEWTHGPLSPTVDSRRSRPSALAGV